MTKLKNVLTRTVTTTPQLIDETLPARETKFDAKVLVTEDNIINQKLIKRILEEHGITVDLANNGLEAFEKRRNNDYDLLFMDIQMPVMDGIEATHEILDYEEDEEVPHIPIVALTANALKGDRERFLGEGMDEYITKPIETSELLYILNKFLTDKARTVTSEEKREELEETKDLAEAAAKQTEEAVGETVEEASSVDDVITLDDTISLDSEESKEETQKSILIAKKFILEKRVLSKVLDNLGYDYIILEDTEKIGSEIASGKYDIVFADEDLVDESISRNDDKLAIITSVNSKEEIESLIKKYRG